MAKIDVDTNNDALLANVNRYNELFFKVGKSTSETTELSNLQALLGDYIQTASDFNAINTKTTNNEDNIILTNNSLDNILKIHTTGGTASAITVSTGGSAFPYEDGNWLQVEITNAGTINTASIDGGTILNVRDKEGSQLEVVVGDIVLLKYDSSGTPFFLGATRGGSDVELTGTADADDVLSGETFYKNDVDAKLTGTLSLTGDAVANNVLSGKTFYNNNPKAKQTGTMATKGAQTYTPTTSNQTISAGQYLIGNQTILGDADLISNNIKAGIAIFGITGNSNVVDTSAGNATASQILSGRIAFVDGAQVTGVIPSKGVATYTPTTSNQTITSGQYLSGNQTILGDADLVSTNIRSGVSIFGVNGNSNVVNTSGGNLTNANYLVSGITAYSDGSAIAGTLTNRTSGNYAADSISSSSNTLRLSIPDTARYDDSCNIEYTDNDWIEANIKSGVNMFGKAGTFTNDATAGASQILSGYTAYNSGSKITGTAIERKYATGTATTNSSGVITVTGLSFTPNLVVAQPTAFLGTYKSFATSSNVGGLVSASARSDSNTTTCMDVVGSFTSGGFSIGMWSSTSNLNVTWVAYG